MYSISGIFGDLESPIHMKSAPQKTCMCWAESHSFAHYVRRNSIPCVLLLLDYLLYDERHGQHQKQLAQLTKPRKKCIRLPSAWCIP